MKTCIDCGKVREIGTDSRCDECWQLDSDEPRCLIPGGHKRRPDGTCMWCDNEPLPFVSAIRKSRAFNFT